MRPEDIARALARVVSLTLAADSTGAELAPSEDMTDALADARHFGADLVWVTIDRPDWPMYKPRPALPWIGLLAVEEA